MRYLNRTVSLILFLLINIVFITCQPTKIYDLQSCKNELSLELRNAKPLDDFLHGFLYIHYDTVFWNKETNINEQVFRGRCNNILKKPVKGYFLDLYFTSTDLDLPQLPSPSNFCMTNYEKELKECKHHIAAIGCRAHVDGHVCFKHMYIHWKTTHEPGNISGTEFLSDTDLLEALSRGSAVFPELSGDQLMDRLTDAKLLEDLYCEHEDRRKHMETLARARYALGNYNEVLENYYKQYDKDLFDARFRIYGVGDVAYTDLHRENTRRNRLPKLYDHNYALHLFNEFKKCDSSKFKSHEQYCEKYLELQNNQSNLYSFNNVMFSI